MPQGRYVSVLVSAVRLILGLMLWLACAGIYGRFAAGGVTMSILALPDPAQAEVIGISGSQWAVVSQLLAIVILGIALGVGLGWLAAKAQLWLHLDWPHWAFPSLVACAVIVGVTYSLGGFWSLPGNLFMLATFGPILAGQFVGVRFSKSRRAAGDVPESSIQQAHRAGRHE